MKTVSGLSPREWWVPRRNGTRRSQVAVLIWLAARRPALDQGITRVAVVVPGSRYPVGPGVKNQQIASEMLGEHI